MKQRERQEIKDRIKKDKNSLGKPDTARPARESRRPPRSKILSSPESRESQRANSCRDLKSSSASVAWRWRLQTSQIFDRAQLAPRMEDKGATRGPRRNQRGGAAAAGGACPRASGPTRRIRCQCRRCRRCLTAECIRRLLRRGRVAGPGSKATVGVRQQRAAAAPQIGPVATSKL